ncbi:hypothetical protein [Nostoc sp.]
MTLTFNSESYTLLLAKHQPKVITNNVENEQAILIAEELAHRTNRTSEESALYDLLIALIEKYRLGNEPQRTQRTQRKERRNRDVIFTNDLGLLYVAIGLG